MVELDDYEKMLIKANKLSMKDRPASIKLLIELIELIESDPDAFYSKYPNRKNDLHNLKTRIKNIKRKLVDTEKKRVSEYEAEHREAMNRIMEKRRMQMYDDLIKRIESLRSEGMDKLSNGIITDSYNVYREILDSLESFKESISTLSSE